jgi:DMSO/TMAO reductase YedYZ heme-binding membrane subunit
MIKILFDFLQFILSCAPLLTSLTIFTLLSVWLAKSIKKNSKIIYIISAIPFLLVAIPTVLRWCGVETMNFVAVPVLGHILRDYIHMGTLGHPLLIIIMYMGALNPRIPFVKRLMSIRKELSIIVGFPVLTHSLIRTANNFLPPLQFFTDREEYLANTPVVSELGAGISSFSLVLGIVMLAIFLPLWITSFDSVRKQMSAVKWKKLQKWSYALYATLFIHAVGIAAGGMMNPRESAAPRPAVEVSAQTAANPRSEQAARPMENRAQNTQSAPPRRAMPKSFSDFQVSRQTRQYIHLASLVLIYGSYLYLRVRKARKAKASSL